MVISGGKWYSDAEPGGIQKAIDGFYNGYEWRHLVEGTIKPGQRLAMESRLVSKYSVRDGPLSEASEVAGGYWFIAAGSMDEAAKIAAQNPCPGYGLSLERPRINPEKGSACAVTCETPAGGLTANA